MIMRKKLPHGSFLLRFTNSSNSGQSGIKGTKGSGPGAISRHGGTRFVIRGNQSVLSGRSSHEFSHLFQHYGRIFVHFRPIQRSKIVPQGEPTTEFQKVRLRRIFWLLATARKATACSTCRIRSRSPIFARNLVPSKWETGTATVSREIPAAGAPQEYFRKYIRCAHHFLGR